MDISSVNSFIPATAKIETGKVVTVPGDSNSQTLRSEKSGSDEKVAPEKVSEQTAIESDQLEKVASDLNDMMSVMHKGLSFKVDEKSGQHVVSVMDIESGDLIRQIPTEEALELAEKLSVVAGLLMKTEA
ncbi:flagellar protein FlaG [Shewanella cyperi]|nr:flagellar protein FlaG [Shewanella cyperi]QSX42658.1 flagellar protein FlaG [Shewanella cyperi]